MLGAESAACASAPVNLGSTHAKGSIARGYDVGSVGRRIQRPRCKRSDLVLQRHAPRLPPVDEAFAHAQVGNNEAVGGEVHAADEAGHGAIDRLEDLPLF
jgi:hypothetical protein